MAAEGDRPHRPVVTPVGWRAPEFRLFGTDGGRPVPYSLADCLADGAALLAFVPQDAESGRLTVRDVAWFQFLDGVAPVVVSDVAPAERPAFADAIGDGTVLLHDPSGRVAATYGVSFDGERAGPTSAAVLVDGTGIVRGAWPDPRPADFSQVVTTSKRFADTSDQ